MFQCRKRLCFEPENGLACWRDLSCDLSEQGAGWDSGHLFLLKPEARFLPLIKLWVRDIDRRLEAA